MSQTSSTQPRTDHAQDCLIHLRRAREVIRIAQNTLVHTRSSDAPPTAVRLLWVALNGVDLAIELLEEESGDVRT